MPELRVGIVGATGFTGSELVRLLKYHPDVTIEAITSESKVGQQLSEVHPFLKGIADNPLISVDDLDESSLDVVFLALPHGVSMDFVKRFASNDFVIIDLSGDFRLSSAQTYEEWYGKKHVYPEGFDNAAYGIPELFRDEIGESDLIANPGCYPTCASLGLAPMMRQDALTDHVIIVDSKSGVTGAGVKSKPVNHFSAVNDNFKAYGVRTHRHTVEIEETAHNVSGSSVTIQFTPHLLPVDRGIFSTMYLRPRQKISDDELYDLYAAFYHDKPFVRVCQNIPSIKDVRATNYCDVYAMYDDRTGNVIVTSVIDNLMKGAAGQAVQNMNLRMGLDETAGLEQVPVSP